MPIYFTSSSIPELKHVSPADRQQLLRRLAPRTFRHWQTWAALFVAALCVGLGAYGGWIANHGSGIGAGIGAILGAAIGGGILGQVKGALVRPYLRAELQRQAIK